jgi:hypothetical protein
VRFVRALHARKGLQSLQNAASKSRFFEVL